jgi:hypothetical protein
MATVSLVSSPIGSGYTRTGTAQADTGQTDWIPVPAWARFVIVRIDWTAAAGTTPVLTPAFYGMNVAGLDEESRFKIAEHTAFTGMTTVRVNEVQTITLSAGIATETFKLTNGGVESTTAVTLPTGGYANVTAAQIKACLLSIPAWNGDTANIAVVKAANDYAVTFSGRLGRTNIGDTTITSKTGAADGSVANTTAGVPGAGFTANIGPAVTGIADDVTNSATAESVVSLNAVLPPILGVELVLDRTSQNETYTYTMTVRFLGK